LFADPFFFLFFWCLEHLRTKIGNKKRKGRGLSPCYLVECRNHLLFGTFFREGAFILGLLFNNSLPKKDLPSTKRGEKEFKKGHAAKKGRISRKKMGRKSKTKIVVKGPIEINGGQKCLYIWNLEGRVMRTLPKKEINHHSKRDDDNEFSAAVFGRRPTAACAFYRSLEQHLEPRRCGIV
jgi:hypothetical protein